MKGNGIVCVNVLSARHEPLSRLFGGGIPVDERFAAGAWSTLETGAPVLADAAAAFDCRMIDIVKVGTHDVFFCSVVALQRSDCVANLIYFARDYHVVRVWPVALKHQGQCFELRIAEANFGFKIRERLWIDRNWRKAAVHTQTASRS